MRQKIFLLLLLIAGFAACKKDNTSNTTPAVDSTYVLKGIYFTDLLASPAGKMGNPEDTLEVDSTSLFAYPNPSIYQFAIAVATYHPTDTAFTCRLVHAIYPAAPDSFFLGKNFPIIVKNESLVGKEVFRQWASITEEGNVYSGRLTIDVKDYPAGFYRVFVETSAGIRLTAGIYKADSTFLW